uniref:NADH-ubiquinone oxidoreductase chain 2 n=1 Tax=Scaphisoma boleti TaxID=1588438 RepID=A0A0S2M889_9COLE|nr:NADH deshydrogenase subunit 2 [Scaphisoma boleti]
MFFLSITIVSSFITISANSWLGMWMGLEINLLSIIPLMNNMNPLSTEASLKYFITQAMASTLILLSIISISMKMEFFYNHFNHLIFNSALITKMGMAPFHFWFPEIIDGLTWMMTTLMLTWQKIAPMILLMYNLNYSNFFFLIIIIAMLISGINGLNQISLRKILVFSSINHMAWMISSLLINKFIWLIYFLIYALMTIFLTMNFHINNIFFFNQMISLMNKNIIFKFFFIFNFLSLGGIPPFIGFFPKWLIIHNLINMKFYNLALLMILLTLFTLFFYTRLMFSSLLLNFSQSNFFLNKTTNLLMISMNFMFLNSLIFSTFCINLL